MNNPGIVATGRRDRGAIALLVTLLVSVLSIVPAEPAQAQASQQTVNPTEHYRLMRTPGVGMQDFVGTVPPTAAELAACTYDTTVDDVGLKGGSVYVRLMWDDFEPAEDQFDWSLVDRVFECAVIRDQTVDLRVMTSYPANGEFDCWDDPSEDDNLDHGIPCWLVRKGVSELVHDGAGDTEATYLPDWEDATIRAEHAELINAMGQRYGSNPRLNSVDIGSLGFWGEWHTYPNTDQLMPSDARRIEIIDLYASAFPNTPLVLLAEVFKDQVGGDTVITDYLSANYSGRYGWRGDSWGQLGHHVYDYQPIHNANPNLWKTGPVAMEVTGIMDWWAGRMGGTDYQSVLPLDTTVLDALNWHSSLAHNKAANIPVEYVNDGDTTQRDLRLLARRMGTRLVPTELTFDTQVTAGSTTSISSTWHNRAVAPLYHDYRIWYRLSNGTNDVTIRTTTSLEGLLPTRQTPVTYQSALEIPASLAAGEYRLDIAVAHYQDVDLKMPLAINNPDDDNWFDIGSISVGGGDPSDAPLTGITASAAVNNNRASNIIDGNPNTSWDNGGDPANAVFVLDLGQATEVTRIRYQDDFNRKLLITLDGVEVFDDWTSGAAENTFAEIVVSPATTGQQLRFEMNGDGNWLVPDEVQVFGSPDPAGTFACTADAGVLTWTDIGSPKYRVFRAGNGVDTFKWLGRTVGSPAGTTFTDQGAVSGYRYQIRNEDNTRRATCSIDTEPPAFECSASGGALTWTDTAASKYRVYRSIAEGQPFRWLTRTIGSPAPTTVTDSSFQPGYRYALQFLDGGRKVRCVDAGLQTSVLIDMHNDFLLGQNHVWTPLNGNQGSLLPSDRRVQTFAFSNAVTRGATSAEFSALSASTELDPGELIVYFGPAGTKLVSRVETVSGTTATFSPPIQQSLNAGAKFWSLYGDAAHPNRHGYQALGDFAFAQFSPAQITEMQGTNHLFLGDSWMQAGSSTWDGRLADRIEARFDGTINATNKAVGGRTTADILTALPVDFPVGTDVDYVWLITGTNDFFQRVPAADMVSNLAQIVEQIEDQGAVAIVLNSSVGQLDGSLVNEVPPRDPEEFLNRSREYVVATQEWFDGR